MTFPGVISLALSLIGKPPTPAKKRVIVGPTLKSINEFLLKLAPDIDPRQVDKKVIDDTASLCAFLASCGYEKVYLYYHGYSTGLTLSESGERPTFTKILGVLRGMPVKSAIKEIELFSCLSGSNAVPLLEIAQYLKTRLFASTFLRERYWKQFDGINQTVLKNLNVFRNYVVLGPEPDIATYLQRHGNKLVYECFFPLSFDAEVERLRGLKFETMSSYETLDALFDVQNGRIRSFADAERMMISDLPTAMAKQADFLSPQFSLFAWVEFVGV